MLYNDNSNNANMPNAIARDGNPRSKASCGSISLVNGVRYVFLKSLPEHKAKLFITVGAVNGRDNDSVMPFDGVDYYFHSIPLTECESWGIWASAEDIPYRDVRNAYLRELKKEEERLDGVNSDDDEGGFGD